MNASDIIADRLIQRGIYLERYKAGFNNRILAELEKLEDGLTRELVTLFSKGVPNPSRRVQRLENLLGETRHVIRRAYAEKKSLSGKELTRLAANEQAYVVSAINDTAGIEIADRVLNYDELKKLTDDTLIQGAKSADWWDRQGEDLQKRFGDQMRHGVLRGETLDQLTARVRGTQARAFTDGVMPATKRQAEALVRTSVQAVANETRDQFYKANADIVNAIQWIATLDSRTTHICMALSGKMWTTEGHKPIGHSLEYPGATAHWNCRSTQVAVLKKWEDLVAGQDEAELDEEFRKQLAAQGFSPDEIAKIKRNTRASMDGQVARDISFDEWLKSKPPEFQDQMLGKGKGRLFRDGKITLTDLVDQRLRPLTIDELELLPQPRPGPMPVKLPSRRKKKVPAPAPARAPGEFPPIDEIETVKSLGGSTGALLVKDTKTGAKFVKKGGKSADHIREEFAADQAYRAAGIDVPRAVLYDTPAGPVKVAEFIEGEDLGTYLAKASPADADAVIGKVRKGFTADALLANHDVAGLSMDNIIVDAKGTPWRIDNGGSLRFRAQGAPKSSAVWNALVSELETLRDSAVNPQTARIFAGITEGEIEEQIKDLLTRESAILDAVPEAVRPVLRERFRNLRERLDRLVTDDVAKRVAESNIKGTSLVSDRDEFEDVQFLAWEELDEAGNPITAAKVKLTERGAEKVMAAIQESIPKKSKVAVAKPLPEDSFWHRIETALKTINHHAGNGQYNVAKVQAMKAAKAELEALATPTTELANMKGHYLAAIQSAEQAMAGKAKTPTFEQYTVKPVAKTPKATPATPKFSVKAEELTWPVKTYDSGKPQRTNRKVTVSGNTLKQEGYSIQVGTASVRLIPYRPNVAHNSSLGHSNGQALMGTLEIELQGAATRESINAVVETMKQIGLSPVKANDEYLEAVWLRKTLAMRTDRVDNATRARIREIMELEGTPDAERVRQLRSIAVEKLGIEPPRDPALWRPRPAKDGRGWGVTERWDMPVETVTRDLKDFALTHHTGTDIPELVESLLRQGAELTSTVERVRKGVDVRNGMSPEADLVKGGGTHLYTRINSRSSAYRQTGFVFKAAALARQDAFSFSDDWYGGVNNFFNTDMIYSARAKTTDQLKRFANNSSNETLFKWNLSIVEEIEAIVVSSQVEKAAVIRKFEAAGIKVLPDGRKVADIVRTIKDPLP